jgi:hypothetical protein
VPVPSDMVISPFAIPWFINSSIMKDVSPFIFNFFVPKSFPLPSLVGDAPALDPKVPFFDNFEGEPMTPFLGPFSLF